MAGLNYQYCGVIGRIRLKVLLHFLMILAQFATDFSSILAPFLSYSSLVHGAVWWLLRAAPLFSID